MQNLSKPTQKIKLNFLVTFYGYLVNKFLKLAESIPFPRFLNEDNLFSKIFLCCPFVKAASINKD